MNQFELFYYHKATKYFVSNVQIRDLAETYFCCIYTVKFLFAAEYLQTFQCRSFAFHYLVHDDLTDNVVYLTAGQIKLCARIMASSLVSMASLFCQIDFLASVVGFS